MKNGKITVSSEIAYIVAIITLAFAVSMSAAADFGVSMIVAPAYIMSRKFAFLTFGQWEYVLQSVLLALFCITVKKIKLVYFSSYLTCIIYGSVLDLWRVIIPLLNPSLTAPGSMALPVRVVLFISGTLLTSFSISLFFRTYLYPQVYDFCVKGISLNKHLDIAKFKICFDVAFLVISTVMTLCFFGKFIGVGVGTLIITCCNGLLIKGFGIILDKLFVFKPFLPDFAKKFDI